MSIKLTAQAYQQRSAHAPEPLVPPRRLWPYHAVKCWEKYLDNINDEIIADEDGIDLDFSIFIDKLIESNQFISNKVRIKSISDRIYVLRKVYLEELLEDNLDLLNFLLNELNENLNFNAN